jgi:hypothetical protein
MILLLKLLLAHMIGDFLLQPKSWVADKEKHKIRSTKLYLHIALHGALLLLVLWDLSYWLLAVIIMVAHGVIDTIKLYAQKESNKAQWFLVDQALHLLSILILWVIWVNPNMELNQFMDSSTIWVYATALVFLTIVSSIVLQVLMLNWSNALRGHNIDSLRDAGRYIGILERLFVFTFVVYGHWEAIGFLLAAKSVFRFGDLKESKDRKLTEYVLIGTLLSFGIAIATALGVLAITGR